MPVASRPPGHRGSGDGVGSGASLERAPGHQHPRDADPVVRGGQRSDALARSVGVQPDRREAADDRGRDHRDASVFRKVDHDRDVAQIPREPMLVVRDQRRVGEPDGHARAALQRRRARGGHRRLDVALLPLQEQQLALGGLQERFELLEGVDREQLEDRHHRPDRHAFQHVHGLGVRGLRAEEVRGQQVLQLFGRDASPFEVPVVEADGGLHEVHELLADVDASVEPVALRPHDPDVPHARIMGEPRRAR